MNGRRFGLVASSSTHPYASASRNHKKRTASRMIFHEPKHQEVKQLHTTA